MRFNKLSIKKITGRCAWQARQRARTSDSPVAWFCERRSLSLELLQSPGVIKIMSQVVSFVVIGPFEL